MSAAPSSPLDPSTFAFLSQSGPTCGHLQLGNKGADGKVYTIGWSGCMLTSLCMISNYLNGTAYTVEGLNQLLTDNGCFLGPLLIVEKAANYLGLEAPDKLRLRATNTPGNLSVVSAKIKETFDAQRVCLFHVDMNAYVKGGDVYGDHFIAAYARNVNGDILCGDPAPGAAVTINQSTTRGDSVWEKNSDGSAKVVKHYTVVGVIPIWKA